MRSATAASSSPVRRRCASARSRSVQAITPSAITLAPAAAAANPRAEAMARSTGRICTNRQPAWRTGYRLRDERRPRTGDPHPAIAERHECDGPRRAARQRLEAPAGAAGDEDAARRVVHEADPAAVRPGAFDPVELQLDDGDAAGRGARGEIEAGALADAAGREMAALAARLRLPDIGAVVIVDADEGARAAPVARRDRPAVAPDDIDRRRTGDARQRLQLAVERGARGPGTGDRRGDVAIVGKRERQQPETGDLAVEQRGAQPRVLRHLDPLLRDRPSLRRDAGEKRGGDGQQQHARQPGPAADREAETHRPRIPVRPAYGKKLHFALGRCVTSCPTLPGSDSNNRAN